jgi:GTP-binding protein HflX
MELPSHQTALLTDTVGFINKLPTMLVAAFRATLEEINEATVIVHVVDVTHPNAPEHMATVNEVLADLAVDDKPTIIALNKVDRCGAAGVPSIDELRLDMELPGRGDRDLRPHRPGLDGWSPRSRPPWTRRSTRSG